MTGTNQLLGGGGLHHVALKTKAWDASVEFYKGTLGFVEKIIWAYPDGNRAGMLDTGGGNYLEIFEDRNYTPTPNGALLHLAQALLAAVDGREQGVRKILKGEIIAVAGELAQ